MRLERHKGAQRFTDLVTCPVCQQAVPRKTHDQVFCSRACWKVRYYGKPGVDRKHYQREQTKHGVSAPALQQSCAALEAQLTDQNRPEWPDIIARFGWPRTPGYRDIARLTREIVASKRRVTL